MSDIEEDIKRCEKLTEPQNANWIGISNQMAIAGALARIKELEEENKEIKNTKMNGYLHENIWLAKYLSELYLPKQKVKDVLQNNRNELFSITYINDKQYKPYTMQIDRINKIENELLEDK